MKWGLWFWFAAEFAMAGEWGRLFFSPQERSGVIASAPARYDGVLVSARARHYWVDGIETPKAPPVQVRPGEIWDRQTGTLAASAPRLRRAP